MVRAQGEPWTGQDHLTKRRQGDSLLWVALKDATEDEIELRSHGQDRAEKVWILEKSSEG